jgi:hypothetical protein
VQKRRIILSNAKPKFAPIPRAKEHLAQIRFNHRRQPQMRRQRGRGLMRALHRCDVNRLDRFGLQPLAHRDGLRVPLRSEGGIPLPVDHRKTFPAHSGLRFPVPDQQQISAVVGQPEPMLSRFFHPDLFSHFSH